MWNQRFDASTYENDTYGRFKYGAPPSSSADWGWVQHMAASLKPSGRMAVVLDTGAVSRGSGNQGSNKEQAVRKAFVEQDLIEAVLLLPENLFYNTTASGIVMVINRKKRHPGEILLISQSAILWSCEPSAYTFVRPMAASKEAMRHRAAGRLLCRFASCRDRSRTAFPSPDRPRSFVRPA